MDLSAAFRAMCVEYSRGEPSGHVKHNARGLSVSVNEDEHDSGFVTMSNEGDSNSNSDSDTDGDSDRTLTYREFIAAAMINR